MTRTAHCRKNDGCCKNNFQLFAVSNKFLRTALWTVFRGHVMRKASRSTLDLQVQNDEKPKTPNTIQIYPNHTSCSSQSILHTTRNMSSALFAARKSSRYLSSIDNAKTCHTMVETAVPAVAILCEIISGLGSAGTTRCARPQVGQKLTA